VPYKYHTADVFTDVPFGGNQLAVLPNATGLDDRQMLAIAREFNYSETVFVFPAETPAGTRKLRIFTPGSELPFAGHPTVGTAYVLTETGEINLDGDETTIILEEGVGPVPVLIRAQDGKPVFMQLTAARPPERGPAPTDVGALADVLSLELAPRSAYQLRAEARWGWQHGVAPTPALRYSITFRAVSARGRGRGLGG